MEVKSMLRDEYSSENIAIGGFLHKLENESRHTLLPPQTFIKFPPLELHSMYSRIFKVEGKHYQCFCISLLQCFPVKALQMIYNFN